MVVQSCSASYEHLVSIDALSIADTDPSGFAGQAGCDNFRVNPDGDALGLRIGNEQFDLRGLVWMFKTSVCSTCPTCVLTSAMHTTHLRALCTIIY